MKTWKDILGQIVQSGKFTFLLDGIEYKIHAYIPSTNHLDLISVKGKDYQTVSVDECKLIARPISDMSDDEKKYVFNSDVLSYCNYKLSKSDELRVHTMTMKQFLKYIEIGVYPFEDTTDVIFKNKEKS